MDLTIIIPVHDDASIEHCINTIDEQVEILLILNGATKEDLKRCSKLRNVRIRELSHASLSKAYDEGIKSANNSKIILMNADCWFKPGTIALINEALDNNILVRGKVNFLYKTKAQRIIAHTRHMHTNGRRAFAPPLGIVRDKSLLNNRGEYFDNRLPWTEDYEFEQRRKNLKISVHYLEKAQIFHEPIDIIEDLKSAYNYGLGQYKGQQLRLLGYGRLNLSFSGLYTLFKQVHTLFDNKTALYFLIWYLNFFRGYRKGRYIQ